MSLLDGKCCYCLCDFTGENILEHSDLNVFKKLFEFKTNLKFPNKQFKRVVRNDRLMELS